MKSIYNEKDRNKLLARINELGSHSTGEWGKMDVGQMLTHCAKFFTTAYGGQETSRSITSLLFGGNAKEHIISNMAGFKKDLPTDPQFLVHNACEFEPSKKKLLDIITRVASEGPNGLGNAGHPFFGALTAEEWGTLMWKHTDHHLRQFGV